jgi:hypothetical protein
VDILVFVISLWETTSSNVTGRYFSTLHGFERYEST